MQERVVRSICQIIKTRYNDMQTERSMSLLSYWEMKNGYGKKTIYPIIDKTPTHALFIQHYISLACRFH